MADFESVRFGVKFSLPDVLTVKQQLAFRSDLFMAENEDKFERFWIGAVKLLENWECELLPDPQKLNMETETDGRITDIVNFVGTVTAGHMTNIGAVPKND